MLLYYYVIKIAFYFGKIGKVIEINLMEQLKNEKQQKKNLWVIKLFSNQYKGVPFFVGILCSFLMFNVQHIQARYS